ncbi:MAG: DUF58 domain-containing protein [Piscirickettsiaceae bacterium CG_4_9_14_3_um_filter_43_564]|nr:DUF58 domain-containing protein [Thiomicrospira sp.]OIP94886.1 MAG: hypothetical protein AUK56_07550 [Thiomicrospira sp. CG2_30_44_34]PIQ05912.1 MAG: DUF58 domain-containing protein [Piscirickettsiaceae bacterium CG18_big_fil_WC_8_21_14_2_50_44_103]PIU37681.1 MAG: DUF58 domain-containing protein [Piscirickettsiaceae bacterium CG07_land_8_20_14_0_80_44_28]PIW57276.1 MAG: DUF58 domain-containing protein [Piscirickettsiaceae bacterium CG12_big_fil_rev_8_21_14_0_65_44_934]PIW77063.1 MAG: DUF58 
MKWLGLSRWVQKGLAVTTASAFVDQVSSPILSEAEIHRLADEIADVASRPIENPKASEALKQGEQASRYLGSGMEYEESRLYQPGDEVRRLNWRLMARTGQAYTKLFQEERQEGWVVILDQRPSMRFGTQSQLKVTQATRVAGFFAWQAEQSNLPFAAVALGETVRNSAILEGRSTYARFMDFAAVPCPPLAIEQGPQLEDELLDCQHRLKAGDRLLIISDFKDLTERALQLLAALQAKVMVKAILIYDPVEKQLPAISGMSLHALSGEGQLKSLTSEQQQAYHAWAADYFAEKHQQLVNSGVWVVSLATTETLAQLNYRLMAEAGHVSFSYA